MQGGIVCAWKRHFEYIEVGTRAMVGDTGIACAPPITVVGTSGIARALSRIMVNGLTSVRVLNNLWFVERSHLCEQLYE